MAVSADTPDLARQMVREFNLTYPVLSDVNRKFILDYNVLHPQEGIARPSAFILDREGKIRWYYVGMAASDRPPIGAIMAELDALQ